SFFGDVSEQHSQAAVGVVSLRNASDTASLPVDIELPESGVLAAHSKILYAARCHRVKILYLGRGPVRRGKVPIVKSLSQARIVHARYCGVEEAAAIQLGKDTHDAACAVHVLDVVIRIGAYLADAGHLSTDSVN